MFHVLKNDSRWSFYAVLFMQKLNSVYQNLYDIESDYELRHTIEKMFIMSRVRFFKNLKGQRDGAASNLVHQQLRDMFVFDAEYASPLQSPENFQMKISQSSGSELSSECASD